MRIYLKSSALYFLLASVTVPLAFGQTTTNKESDFKDAFGSEIEKLVSGKTVDELNGDELTAGLNRLLKGNKYQDYLAAKDYQRSLEKFQSRPELGELIKSKKIGLEIEMVPEQKHKLEQMVSAIEQAQEQARISLVKPRSQLIGSETLGSYVQEIAKLKGNLESSVTEILLPQQVERLQQIAFQIHVRNAGEGIALVHPKVVKALDISKEQKERITSRTNELSKKLDEDKLKLTKKKDSQLLDVLTAKQRETFEELVGERYKLDNEFLSLRRMSSLRPEVTHLLLYPRVRQYIDLVDDQSEQVRQILKDAKFLKETNKRLGKVLLPHQQEVLNQIATQAHIKHAGTTAALLHPDTAESLGITDEQEKRLQESAEELAKKLEDNIASLKNRSKRELFSELSAEQRLMFKKLMGPELDLAGEFDRQ